MRVVFVTSPALALLIAGSASADPPAPPPAAPMAAPAPTPQLSPTEILERMEGTNNMADQTLNMRLTVVEVNGTRRAYEFTFQQKGTKRLVEFTSGESKGMSVLVEDRDTVYVYLPGFRKVRRVATSEMSQPMVGSDLSSEDMATASWTTVYDASLGQGGRHFVVALPRPQAGRHDELREDRSPGRQSPFPANGDALFQRLRPGGEELRRRATPRTTAGSFATGFSSSPTRARAIVASSRRIQRSTTRA